MSEMQWELVVVLVIAIPIIILPAAFVWNLTAGGIVAAVKEARAQKAAAEKGAHAGVTTQ
jgi:hypothetical protein